MKDDLAKFPTPSEAFGSKKKPSLSSAHNSLGDVPRPPPQRFRRTPDSNQSAGSAGGPNSGHNGYYGNQPPSNYQNQSQYGRPMTGNLPPGQPPMNQQTHSLGFANSPPVSQRYYQPQGNAPQQHQQHYQPQGVAQVAPQGNPGAYRRPVPAQAQQQYQQQHSVQSQQEYSAPRRPTQPPVHTQVGQFPGPIPGQPYSPNDQYGYTNSGPGSVPNQPSQSQSNLSGQAKTKVPDLRTLFDEVDRQKRGYLTERELSKALVNGDYSRFDPRTVRLMIRMFDRDGDGAIYFAEFGQLWKYLHEWRNIFIQFDVDGSECITLEEFNTALKAFGYNLSSNSVEFMFKAGSRLSPRNGLPEMSFDMFVQSCINIKSITDIFKQYDTDRDGYITMSFEDFMMESTKLS